MQPSMELRWFLAGTIPEPIQQWFSQSATAPKSEGRRDDVYLWLPDADDVGIKHRQGRIEVKRRLAQRGVHTLGDGIAGRIEQWVKWSFVLEKAQPVDLTKPVGSWVTVEKHRQLKKYEVHQNDEVRLVAPDGPVEQGCNLELTALVLNGAPWWSIGFEAFGEMEAVETNLIVTINYVLSENNFPPLRAEDSYSFPHWLRLHQE